LFRSRLDQIIDLKHALATLPMRLMAGLAIIKHAYDLSDEVLCER
jgi:hypothetical protein